MVHRLGIIIESRSVLAISILVLGLTLWGHFERFRSDAEMQALRDAFDLRDYIDVQAVTIEDAPVGQPILLGVIRVLKQDFTGAYLVTIRNADGGEIVCTTGEQTGPYRALDENGNPTQLPSPLPLTWWAWGGSCTGALERGLPVGHYAVETCHAHLSPPGFDRPQWVCWRPVALFHVTPSA